MRNVSKMVHPIHFEDFDGRNFERLVFAYHVRAGWNDVAWYGQGGGDRGRDIIGTERLDDSCAWHTVIQCANRSTLTKAKAEADMQKAMAAIDGLQGFKFVARGAVSATRRDAILAVARNLGINHLTIWSGVEFEEHLRLIGADLLKRFCEGEVFPDAPDDLRRFADDFDGIKDIDALSQMAAVLDRPAFRTPFQQESSIPAFLTAIEDTILAFNTGIWQTRKGDEIRRIPTIHHLRNAETKAKVSSTVQLIDQLRRTFVSGLREESIRPCSCGDANCSVFMVDPDMIIKLDDIRQRALGTFRSAHPEFDVVLH